MTAKRHWATGVQLYDEANQRIDVEGRDGLVAYDRTLAALVAELMHEDWTYACPS